MAELNAGIIGAVVILAIFTVVAVLRLERRVELTEKHVEECDEDRAALRAEIERGKDEIN